MSETSDIHLSLTSLAVEEAETTLCATVHALALIFIVLVRSYGVFGHQMHHQNGFQEAQQHQCKVADAVDGCGGRQAGIRRQGREFQSALEAEKLLFTYQGDPVRRSR